MIDQNEYYIEQSFISALNNSKWHNSTKEAILKFIDAAQLAYKRQQQEVRRGLKENLNSQSEIIIKMRDDNARLFDNVKEIFTEIENITSNPSAKTDNLNKLSKEFAKETDSYRKRLYFLHIAFMATFVMLLVLCYFNLSLTPISSIIPILLGCAIFATILSFIKMVLNDPLINLKIAINGIQSELELNSALSNLQDKDSFVTSIKDADLLSPKDCLDYTKNINGNRCSFFYKSLFESENQRAQRNKIEGELQKIEENSRQESLDHGL